MSSDNGTYVLQTYGPEFRIGRVNAVENLFYEQNPDTQKWSPNVKEVYEAFHESKVYKTVEEAWDKASAIEELEPTEFGVNLVRDFEALKFQTIADAYKKTPV